MTRNLGYRVEAATPVHDPAIRRQLAFNLELILADNRKVWKMDSDGEYQQRRPSDDEQVINTQEILMQEAMNVSQDGKSTMGLLGDCPLDNELLISGQDSTGHAGDRNTERITGGDNEQ